MTTARNPATALLVLGMHRSGTSALARLLNLRGAALGRDLLPPKADNERGFWENRELLRLHEALLAGLGVRWHDPVLLPPGWRDSAPARRFVADLPATLEQQFGAAPLYAIKDPRLALLLPLWREVLDATETRAAAVIVVRHPAEVAASLARRDGFAPEHSQLLWLQHCIDAERNTRGMPRVFVHYERLLADWRRELGRIDSALAVDWPAPAHDFDAQVDAFIAPSLRHHRSDRDAGPPPPELVERAYLHASTAAADLPFANDVSDALAADAERALDLAGPVYRALSARQEQARAEHEAEVEHARQTVAAKDAEIGQARLAHAELERQIAAARANIDAQAADLANARRVIDGKDAELDAARGVIAAKDGELAAARAVIAAKDGELAAARAVIAGKDVELGAARETVAAKDFEIEAARRSIEALAADLARAHDALAQQRGELETARATIDDMAAQIDSARAGFAAKEAEIDAARRNIDALVAEIGRARDAHAARDQTENALHAEIAALREASAALQAELAAVRGSRWFRIGRALRLLDRQDR